MFAAMRSLLVASIHSINKDQRFAANQLELENGLQEHKFVLFIGAGDLVLLELHGIWQLSRVLELEDSWIVEILAAHKLDLIIQSGREHHSLNVLRQMAVWMEK